MVLLKEWDRNAAGEFMANITFIVDTGCQFSGISGLIDSFTIANRWHATNTGEWSEPLFTSRVLSQDGKAVKVSGGFQVMPEGTFQDCRQTDVVVVPPYLPSVDFLPVNARSLLDWIITRYEQGVTIASVCTGSFVLAETGLLNGRLATTHWYYTKLFRRRYPKVLLEPDRVLTRDKGLICSGSVSAFYYLALHLIESFGSSLLAAQCAKSLLVEPSKASQSSYAVFNVHKSHGDQEILRAQELIESHFADAINMKDLAGKVGISPRNFIRRFKKATDETPLSYLQQIRIERAKDYLETTLETVNEITQVIGYENSSSFRKLFKEATGLSPSEYRSRFTRGESVETSIN
jgi:transcriptional regulator GlxA family with amidase domain